MRKVPPTRSPTTLISSVIGTRLRVCPVFLTCIIPSMIASKPSSSLECATGGDNLQLEFALIHPTLCPWAVFAVLVNYLALTRLMLVEVCHRSGLKRAELHHTSGCVHRSGHRCDPAGATTATVGKTTGDEFRGFWLEDHLPWTRVESPFSERFGH
jgi:hypothetical protein